MVDVAGDGACQFRALAHQLRGNEGGHADVRRDVVEYLRRHPPAFHDVQVYHSGAGRVETPTLEAYAATHPRATRTRTHVRMCPQTHPHVPADTRAHSVANRAGFGGASAGANHGSDASQSYTQ